MDLALPLLAQAAVTVSSGTTTFDRILASLPWFAWIAIVGIVCGSLSEIVKMALRHNERMAMIRMGMNPDAAEPAGPAVDAKPRYPEAAEL